MPVSLGPLGAVKVPDVSQTDIEAFHAQHFSGPAIQLFASEFLQPQPQPNYEDQSYEEYYEEYEEEDDGLGYYPDGVKRTLTDEQIAIFRHSELEALRRAEEKEAAKASRRLSNALDIADESLSAAGTSAVPEPEFLEEGEEEGEEGEIESDSPQPDTSAASKKKKKRKKSKKNKQNSAQSSDNPQRGEHGWFKKTVKPDLRKRTWDVVDTGMDSLDYDGFETAARNGSTQASQRRKISYDD